MALIHPRVRLPSSIYEDNYGYTINYYQPMIDYLDTKYKQQNCSKQQNINYNRTPPPHLPWTNERGLKQYRPSNLVRPYTNNDINIISKSVASSANENLINRSVYLRSPFSVIKIADASRILKHLPTDTAIERQFKREKEHKLREKEFDERERKGIIRLKNIMESNKEIVISSDLKRAIRGKSANAISAALLAESDRNIRTAKREEEEYIVESRASQELFKRGLSENRYLHTRHIEVIDDRLIDHLDHRVSSSLINVKRQLTNLNTKNVEFYAESSKATAIEIEQLNARVVEAETRLKTEVARIKKKLQIQITELEMSLDVANKTNIDLQKIIKKQSLQLTELQAHYDEIQRQLQQTLDQYTVAQRRLQAMNGELEEVRLNLDTTQRAKRQVELQCEECVTRINELTVVNVNLVSTKNKIEQELAIVASDYEEITKELRISDERYQKVQIDLKHTIETLHDEQERIVKIETIKKSLEVEVKNLSIRLEEVEANAVAGAKRIITKLEARIRDLELELEEEKRRHAETIKILRKKERTVKEVMIQCEEDQKNINLLQEALECSNSKVHLYKRQLAEQEGMSAQSVTRVRRFQRELEAAEDRADCAETNLNMIRAKHRTFVTTSTTSPNSVYMVQETRTITE